MPEVVLVAFTLPIFSYLTLIYRELGRMTTGRIHTAGIFEAEIEPKLRSTSRAARAGTFPESSCTSAVVPVLETTPLGGGLLLRYLGSFVDSSCFLCSEVVIRLLYSVHAANTVTTGRCCFPFCL